MIGWAREKNVLRANGHTAAKLMQNQNGQLKNVKNVVSP